MNKAILLGYLNFDNELRVSSNGKEMLSNSIGVKNDYKNAEGKYEYQNIRFSAFGNTAKFINEYIKKGDKFLLEGRVVIGKKDGVYIQSVIADKVELLPNTMSGFTEIEEDDDEDIF